MVSLAMLAPHSHLNKLHSEESTEPVINGQVDREHVSGQYIVVARRVYISASCT